MGGKIYAYLDCVSPYSLYTFIYLTKNKEALRKHGVDVEFFPVFQGGIMQGSGNKPPWTVPNKAKIGAFDGKRAQKYFGVSFETPSFFPIMSLLPQRSMTYIKDNYPQEMYEAMFRDLWVRLWEQHWDISKPDKMTELLVPFVGAEDAKKIVEATSTPEVKTKLNATTQLVLDAGAFGCPFHLVTNSKGVTEPFFGSDRYHFMWDYLGLPWQDIAILPKSNL